VKAVHGDLTLPDGTRILGFPPGHETGNTGWPAWITGRTAPVAGPDGKLGFGQDAPNGHRFVEAFFRYMAFEPDDPSYDWRTFDLARDWTKLAEITRILSPVDPDLSGLGQRGAKLLLYHGWADPALSAYGTIDYYNKVVRAAGGKDKADRFVRLFLVPGMHHCSGGPGPNTFGSLTALEQWVEKGLPPKQLLASHATDGKVDRTRPLCPEPLVARYAGTGSVDQAESFRCEVPAEADRSRTTSQSRR
jgi:tannase/feruloyl esterase